MARVSKRSEPGRRPRQRGWLHQHLDGWQAGAAALLVAASAVFLAVPRAVEPTEIPVPVIDHAALSETMARDDALARFAEQEVLDVDIRSVGRELRRFNRAAARGSRQDVAVARREVLTATRRALHRDERELLALRAYQMKRFVAALNHWTRTGEISQDLEELGGAFLELARLSRWCSGKGRALLPSEAVLRTFFKKRWNEITAVRGGPFALTLDEDRTRYGFLLRFPMAPHKARLPSTPIDETRRRLHEGRLRLEVVERLGHRDPFYPAALARGALLFRQGQYHAAAEAFRQHLATSPDGPRSLRAQNYLKAALDRARQELM